MRIACANWSRRHAGGIESYLASIIPALRSLGGEVSFWSEKDEPADREPLGALSSMPEWCAARDGVEESLRALAGWRPAVVFVHGLVDPSLERRILALGPAVFLAHSYYGTCISGGKTTRVPSIEPCTRVLGPACLAHFYPRRCGGLHPLTLAADYRRQTRRLALMHEYRRVLTLSSHMRSEYLRHGLSADRVDQLPPYVPPAPLERAADRDSPDASTVELLFLGRLDRLKGCAFAIEALPLVSQGLGRAVRLVIAGDGPDRDRCRRLAREASSGSIRVEMAGWVGPNARAELLASAQVLVFPSLWPEPYGISGIEAISSGVPVAAFGSGAVPEWLRDGVDGALAPANPPTASGLAAAIVRCVRLGRLTRWPDALVAERQRAHAAAVAGALADAAGRPAGRVVA